MYRCTRERNISRRQCSQEDMADCMNGCELVYLTDCQRNCKEERKDCTNLCQEPYTVCRAACEQQGPGIVAWSLPLLFSPLSSFRSLRTTSPAHASPRRCHIATRCAPLWPSSHDSRAQVAPTKKPATTSAWSSATKVTRTALPKLVLAMTSARLWLKGILYPFCESEPCVRRAALRLTSLASSMKSLMCCLLFVCLVLPCWLSPSAVQ